MLAWKLNFWAWPAGGTGFPVYLQYQEPTNNTDGSPLDDLAYTTIFYELPGGSPTKSGDVIASGLTGGGWQTVTIVIPGTPESAQLWLTATDTSGHESQQTARTRWPRLQWIWGGLTQIIEVTGITGIT